MKIFFSFLTLLIVLSTADLSLAVVSTKESSSKETKTTSSDKKETKAALKSSSSQSATALESGSQGSSNISINTQAASVQVEPFSGSANLSIPIAVPPGRGGIQPNISLNYSSSNRSLGLAGVGWTLDMGSIQRSLKKGVPSYDDTKDIFTLNQGSSQDLVKDPNSSRYYPEIESSFAKIEHVSDYWLVTDKKGIKYYFGSTDDSRQYDASNSSKVFRWALSKVEDLNGNYMIISYMRDQGQIYPQTISYTGNSKQSLNPYAQVQINYVAASVLSTSYITGFKIVTGERIDNIVVNIGSNLQSKYVLSYKQSASTGRDLLLSVQQIGSGGSNSLPQVKFTYSDNAPKEFKLDNSWNISNLPVFSEYKASWHDLDVRVADLNGDGYSDFIKYYGNCEYITNQSVYINNKNKSWELVSGWQLKKDDALLPGFTRNCAEGNYDNGIRLVDLSSKGYPDIIENLKRDPIYGIPNNKISFINDGIGGFMKDSAWDFPDDAMFIYETGIPYTTTMMSGAVLMGDVLGDGYPDIVIARTYNDGVHKVYLNNLGINQTKGWTASSQYVPPSEIGFNDNSNLVDLNGDGLADIMYIKGSNVQIYMNNGHGWEKTTNGYSNTFGLGDLGDGTTQFMDINGDGLVDVIIADSSVPVLINTGDGWKRGDNWIMPEFRFINLGTQFLDANADGLIDYVMNYSGEPSKMYMNQGQAADLLVSVNNGMGTNSSINYESSAHYSNKYLPFILQVVKSVATTVENPIGHASSYIFQYEYSGGLWDLRYREFQGFKSVKVKDEDGNYTLTTYAQDHWLKGRPLEQYTYDKTGRLYSKVVNKWEIQNITTQENAVSNTLNHSAGFNGTTDYLNYPISNDWDFGDQDFTIDFWVNLSSLTNSESDQLSVFSNYSNNQNASEFRWNSHYWTYQLNISSSAVVNLYYMDTPTVGAWNHFAIVRHGNVWSMYKNGVAVATQTVAQVVPVFTQSLLIGARYFNGVYGHLNGSIDEFRVSKGVALWTENFTPPSRNYDNCTENTTFLLHFDNKQETGSCAVNQTSKFVYLSRSDNYLYDASNSPKRTAQELIYAENPQYGDPTQVINYGEVDAATGVDIGTDKIVSQISYVNNTSNWLLGLPSNSVVQDNSGNIISQTLFYYDGSSNNTETPSLGRLTKKTNWLGVSGQADPSSTYTYDTYGNLLTTTDPLGNTSSVAYDNEVHMFPVQTTNALNQSSSSSYFGVAGVALDNGLWGQTKSTTDANNQTVSITYDGFGRPLTTVGPLDSALLPTNQKIYEIFSNYTKITTKARVDNGGSQTIDSVEYYDGLGRLIESKSFGPNSGQYIVSGQKEYNNRGLPIKAYQSRFTSNDLNTMDSIDSSVPASQVQYDAMGRAIKSINPDGISYSNVVYDRWTTTSYDENGHMQKSYKDAFGRLIQKEEYTGADGRASDYPATSYKLYATTSYSYDAKGNLTSVMDAKGNVTTIQYDKLGRKVGMTDPDMGSWQYSYDANGNLISQKDAKGQTIRFIYDKLNRLLNKTDGVPSGPIATFNVTYNYDDTLQNTYGKGRLGSVSYDAGLASFVYDQLGREGISNKNIDGVNYQVSRQYDALSRLKQVQYPDAAQLRYLYNQAGQITAVADSAAVVNGTLAAINPETKLAKSQSSMLEEILGVENAYAASSTKLGVSLTTPVNNSSYMTPVNIVLTASATAPSGGSISKVEFYQGSSLLGAVSKSPYSYTWNKPVVGSYKLTAKVYDNNNKTATSSVISISVVTAPTVSLTTPVNNASYTAPASVTLTASALGTNLSKVEFYNGASLLGAATKSPYSYIWKNVTGGSYSLTAKVYDGYNNTATSSALVITVKSPVTVNLTSPSDNASYAYPTNINLTATALTSSGGTISKVEFYNGTKLLATDSTSPYSFSWSNVAIGTYSIVAKAYDSKNNTASSSVANVSVNTVPPMVSLTSPSANGFYTSPANITLTANASATNATVSKVEFYNGTALLGTATTNPYRYAWNKVAVGSYSITAKVYDSNNATAVSSAVNMTVNPPAPNQYIKYINYNAAGQIIQVKYGNGTITSYSYYPTLWLKRIYTENAQAQKIQDLNYTYDALGQITKITDALNTATQTFKYDELNRLVYAQGSYGIKTYTYDQIGNITQKDGLFYSYGELNSRSDLAGAKAGPHAVTSLSDGSVFKYDANGNMASLSKAGELTTYLYDVQNRLIEIDSKTSSQAVVKVAQYYYDGDGGRTKKVVYRRDKAVYNIKNSYTLLFKDYNGKPWPGTTANTTVDTTRYVGNLYEVESAATDGNQRKTKFIYLGSTRVAAVSADSSVFYYHTDHLGGTNVLTDQAGLARELSEYDPFGLIVKHEKYGDDFAQMWYYFSNKSLDDESGLMFFGARYYNPRLGRWITPDTVVQNTNDPQTLNRYSYCSNNPTNRIDSDGHKWSWKKFWNSFIGAALGAIATVVTLGAAAPLWVAGMVGGFVAGAVTGGLEGGWKGALIGGLIGGALGGIGGWAGGLHNLTGNLILGGMFAAGVATTAANGSWDSFTGGIAGAITGTAIGVTFQSMGAPGTPRNGSAATLQQEKQNQKALSVNQNDHNKVNVGARRVGGKDSPFYHMFVEDGSGNITEMGPGYGPNGKINVFKYNKYDQGVFPAAIQNGGTPLDTMAAIRSGAVQYSNSTMISQSAFNNMVSSYQSVWGSQAYVGASFNSNYAVNTWVYGSGGEITGLTVNRPSFSGSFYEGR